MTQEIIKFLTAGNVDDGKSTLIGRLLHDTDSLYQDQIEEVKKSTDKNFGSELDFSLFLDGLTSERAQKITIDVAYRYFSYENKKFIIADAPGHEQYTRNMAVAAANSDIIIILVDALKGVKAQTIRHSYIAHLFGIKNVIVAVNKMDLINYSYETFDNIRKSYLEKTADLGFEDVFFVPISAIHGYNIAKKSDKISWYNQKTIIEYLVDIKHNIHGQELVRFAVQNVVKYDSKRLYQGFLTSGKIQVGDEIIVFPAKRSAKIQEIIHSEKNVKKANFHESISVVLDQEIDLDRGGIISNIDNQPYFADHFSAYLIWFSPQEFDLKNSKEYFVKLNHNYLRAKISNINHIIDINNLLNIDDPKNYHNSSIFLNQIANINLALSQETAFDLFKSNKNTGSFLLIDKNTNETVACGVISNFLQKQDKVKDKQEEFLLELSQLVKKYFTNRDIDFNI